MKSQKGRQLSICLKEFRLGSYVEKMPEIVINDVLLTSLRIVELSMIRETENVRL